MRTIHLVSFDIPYPADYGGVIAVFDLIKELHRRNIHIILHVFEYNGKSVQAELEDKCKKIYTYKRATGFASNLSFLPYIVASRDHPDLLNNLKKDSLPVIFEGIHTIYWAKELYKYKQNIFLRAHNIEWRYYENLSRNERNIWRKVFFKIESIKLKRYEVQMVKYFKKIFCFTEKDAQWFSGKGGQTKVINPALANIEAQPLPGNGKYILFHGNLSIKDTEESLMRICHVLADHTDIKLVIAGKNPSSSLIKRLSSFKHFSLVVNPEDDELVQLILRAQVNICYTFISEGFKMRLIPLLKFGRFILINSKFCTHPDINSVVMIEDDLEKWPEILTELLQTEFTRQILKQRTEVLHKLSENNNADLMIMTIFELP